MLVIDYELKQKEYSLYRPVGNSRLLELVETNEHNYEIMLDSFIIFIKSYISHLVFIHRICGPPGNLGFPPEF